MLFSATMPSAIVTLARRHLEHPVNIRAESADDETTVPATAQFVYQAHMLDKPEVVARILQAQDRGRVMIFSRTKRSAQRLTDDLVERGFAATSIHGDLNQVAREKALKRFREGKVDVLVATDVAARGIDVTGVTHVINYECPDDEKTYVHRIGRTGRAGRLRHRDHLRRLGRPDPVEGDQQRARAAVRDAGGDLLHLGAPVPRPGHRPQGQGPAERAHAGAAARARHREPRSGPPRGREGGSESESAGQVRDARASEGESSTPSRNRNRRRLRNGVAADAAAESPAGTSAETAPVAATEVPVAEPTQQSRPPATAEGAAEGDGTKRRRRRRGGRGPQPFGAASGAGVRAAPSSRAQHRRASRHRAPSSRPHAPADR